MKLLIKHTFLGGHLQVDSFARHRKLVDQCKLLGESWWWLCHLEYRASILIHLRAQGLTDDILAFGELVLRGNVSLEKLDEIFAVNLLLFPHVQNLKNFIQAVVV